MNVANLIPILSALALAAACEPPPSDPSPGGGGNPSGGAAGTPDGGGSGGPGGGGSGSSGGGSGGGGTASLRLSFDPGEPPAGATGIDVDLAGVALFAGGPAWRDADTPCDGGVPGALVSAAARVELPFGGDPVPFLDVNLPPGGGEIREIWLVVRKGTLRTPQRTYEVHAGRLCRMPDGLQYTLLRARPGAVALGGEREVALDLGRDQLAVEQVDCRATHVAECSTSDDPGDGDPDTRRRYRFEDELPARVIR